MRELQVEIYHDHTPTIQIDGTLYDIVPLPMSKDKLEVGTVYGFDNNKLIYNGEVDNIDKCVNPGFYLVNGEIFVSGKHKEIDKPKVDMDNIQSMLENLSESTISDEDLKLLSETNRAKTFGISDSDSGLDKIIKTTINIKGIDPKIYKSKFNADHTIGNLVSSLRSDSSMTTKMFMRWVETLGLEYQVKVWDSSPDNTPFPMKKTIMYDSRDGSVTLTDLEEDPTV